MTVACRIRSLDGAAVELVAGPDGHWREPGDATPDDEVDGSGWWALPGLADCHAHLGGSGPDMYEPGAADGEELAKANAWAQLAGGVFLVADKGGKDHVVLRLVDEPPTTRPDLHAAGRVIANPGGYYADFAVEVEPGDLAAVVAEEAAARGASWVKLIGDWPRKGVGAVPNFDEDALALAAQVAHRAGKRIAIHAAAPRTSSMAVAAGIDSIEHGLFLTEEDLAALGARGGCWVPTIAAMEGIRDMLGAASSGGKLFAQGLDNVRELLGGALGAGVCVLAGTDLRLPHGGVAAEALRLADYGLDADAVVAALSESAYDYLGQDRGFAPGKAADVVFFDRDPRGDLTALAEPVVAIRHGRMVVDRR